MDFQLYHYREVFNWKSRLLDFWDNLRLKDMTFSDVDLSTFDPVSFFYYNDRLYIGVLGETIVGGIWIYNYDKYSKTGYMGFCFDKDVKDPMLKFEIARESLKQLLDRDMYRMILAEVGQDKEKALQLAMALGFRQYGKLPLGQYNRANDSYMDTYLLYLIREHLK